MPKYSPQPIDTGSVQLSDELLQLTEALAKNAHDHWAQRRFSEGWVFGEQRSDTEKTHPGLIAYDKLSESEKEYDRKTAMETLKAITALGYNVVRKT